MTATLKRLALSIFPLLLIIAPVFAQDEETVSVASFVGSYSLWAAVIIGLIASAVTVYFALQMRGGIVGTSLTLIGAGMFLVVLGFLAVVIQWTAAETQAIVHDVAFILGYVLILVGALRLRTIAGK